MRTRLLRRHRAEHGFEHVVSWFLHDALGRVARRLGAPSSSVNLATSVAFDALVSLFADRNAAAVVCMSGSGVRTMRRHRRHGATTVLVMNTPAASEEHRVVAEEERRLGLRQSRIARWAERRIAARIDQELAMADLVLANSQFTADDLARTGVPRAKIAVASLGVDLERFAPAGGARPRSEIARIVYVGSLAPRKGVITLAEAVRMLRTTRPCELHVYGSGEPRYMRLLESFADDGSVTLHSYVPNAELPDVYRAADVVVLPTLSDGFGLVVYEAMASGAPVVVTDRCGAEVEHGRNGLVVPHSDPRALADAIEQLLSDPGRARTLAAAGVETARHASWARYRETVRASLLPLLDETVDAPGDPHP
ncbi:MAG TPA: glycosyltransferase family 4 protein [Gaiellaceae bacterium]|nr:glycosyltransferase family 4 protein [Gaiellaceae bacterium]